MAGHPQVAGVDVGADVAERVARRGGPTPRGVREHVEHVELGPVGHRVEPVGQGPDGVGRVEGALGLPAVLPPLLDLLGERGGVAVGGRSSGSAGSDRPWAARYRAGPGAPEARSAPAPPSRARGARATAASCSRPHRRARSRLEVHAPSVAVERRRRAVGGPIGRAAHARHIAGFGVTTGRRRRRAWRSGASSTARRRARRGPRT